MSNGNNIYDGPSMAEDDRYILGTDDLELDQTEVACDWYDHYFNQGADEELCVVSCLIGADPFHPHPNEIRNAQERQRLHCHGYGNAEPRREDDEV